MCFLEKEKRKWYEELLEYLRCQARKRPVFLKIENTDRVSSLSTNKERRNKKHHCLYKALISDLLM